MNIIDIIFLAILGVSLISGMQKGFLASLLATFGFVGAWFLARSVCMTLSQQFMTSQEEGNAVCGPCDAAAQSAKQLTNTMDVKYDDKAITGKDREYTLK